MENLTINKQELKILCKKFGISKLSLFGSAITDDFTSNSDIDILVEFSPGKKPGYLTITKIERELSALFGGQKVDLRTPAELSRYFRDDVLSAAEVQYAE